MWCENHKLFTKTAFVACACVDESVRGLQMSLPSFVGADPDIISSTDSEEDSSDAGPEPEPEPENEPEPEADVAEGPFGAAYEGGSDGSFQEDGSQSQYIDSTSLKEDHYR